MRCQLHRAPVISVMADKGVVLEGAVAEGLTPTDGQERIQPNMGQPGYVGLGMSVRTCSSLADVGAHDQRSVGQEDAFGKPGTVELEGRVSMRQI
jgi:hypothetical protein